VTVYTRGVTVYTRGVTVYTYTRGVNLLHSNYILLYTMSSANTSNSKNGPNKKHGSKNEVSQPSKRSNAEVSNTTAEEIIILGDQLEVLGEEISCIREGFKTLVTKEEL